MKKLLLTLKQILLTMYKEDKEYMDNNDKTRIIHLLENYRRTIDVSAISHGLHQETVESAWVTQVSCDS